MNNNNNNSEIYLSEITLVVKKSGLIQVIYRFTLKLSQV